MRGGERSSCLDQENSLKQAVSCKHKEIDWRGERSQGVRGGGSVASDVASAGRSCWWLVLFQRRVHGVERTAVNAVLQLSG